MILIGVLCGSQVRRINSPDGYCPLTGAEASCSCDVTRDLAAGPISAGPFWPGDQPPSSNSVEISPSSSLTRYFGMVVQSSPSEILAADAAAADDDVGGGASTASASVPPDGCYVLKLSQAPGSACSHYSLTKVCAQSKFSLYEQLQSSWIAGPSA